MATPRKKGFDPKSETPLKVSRTAIEQFTSCPRCFYTERCLGIDPPRTLPFTLNTAVDVLLKKEFDLYRERKEPHPLMVANNIAAVPFSHPDLEKWRNNKLGVQFHHTQTNFLVYGAVDDIWVNDQGELIVVDYKATSKKEDITSLDSGWHYSYKRQLEVYQWLLRQNGFDVSKTCYWVYANGDKSKDRFDATLSFRMTVIPYEGSDQWIEKTLGKIRACIDSESLPDPSEYCDLCRFVSQVKNQQ